MKKIRFIQKLVIEKVIALTEESKNISNSYSKKSANNLKAAKILYEQKLFEEATSMSYYTMYNKFMSLFFLIGLKCVNHAASIILLKELFEIDNNDLSFAKEERIDKQYYPDFKIAGEDTKSLIEISLTFIEKLDLFIDSLTESKRKEYRDNFRKTYLS